jgi:hypothetical protein
LVLHRCEKVKAKHPTHEGLLKSSFSTALGKRSESLSGGNKAETNYSRSLHDDDKLRYMSVVEK